MSINRTTIPIIKPISGPFFISPVNPDKKIGSMIKKTAPAWMHALIATQENSLFTSALVMINPIFKIGIHDKIINPKVIPA